MLGQKGIRVLGKAAMVKEEGLRPFDPLRDIWPVADLVQLAFAEEARDVVLGMRSAALLGPFIWALARVSPEVEESLLGFVWVEKGRIVGNVSLNKGSTPAGFHSGGDYLISNLAVHPRYRRRGIARSLMEAAIDEARRRDGRRVVLEVRRTNLAAKALYERLGFMGIDVTSEMRLENLPPVEPLPCAGIREFKASDGEGVAGLFRAASSGSGPLMPEWGMQGLIDLLTLRKVYRWVAEGTPYEGQTQGLTVLHASWGFLPHRLEMVVHPQRRGELEEAMLTRALFTLRTYPRRKVVATLHPSYDEIRGALERYGFGEVKTLMKMALEIGR